MPNLIIPSHITKELADELRALAPILMNELAAPENLHDSADAAYKAHIAANNDGNTLFDDACALIDDNSKPDSQELQRAKSALHTCLVAYSGLHSFLTTASENDYSSGTLRELLNTLTGADGNGGLSKAIREFDWFSGYAHTRSPQLKTLTTMAGYAEKVAMRIEALAIRQRDDEVRAQNLAAEETIRKINAFNTESVSFVTECLNEGVHVGEPRELENARDKVDQLQRGFERKAKLCEQDIIRCEAAWKSAREQVTEEEDRLTDRRDELVSSEENTAEIDSQTAKNDSALTALEAEISACDEQLQAQESKLNAGIRDFDLQYQSVAKKLPSEAIERHRVLSDALANVADTVDQTGDPERKFAPINEKSAQRLLDIFRKGRGAEKLDPAEKQYFVHLSRMADSIDLLNPDAKRVGGGLFRRDHSVGADKAIHVLQAHMKKLKEDPEAASLKRLINKEMYDVDGQLSVARNTLVEKNRWLDSLESISLDKGKFLSAEQPKLYALEDKKKALVERFMQLKNLNLKDAMDRPALEAKKESQKKAIADQQAAFEAATKALTEAEAKAVQAQAALDSVKNSLKNISAVRSRIDAIDRKVQLRQDAHTELSNQIDTMRKGFVDAALQDDRIARFHEKLTELASHIDENKGLHRNGGEYKQMAAALRTLVAMTAPEAVDSEGSAITPAKLEAPLADLANAAQAYTNARSRDIFQHGSAFRHMRLNFARELKSWAEDAAEDLRIQPREKPDLQSARYFAKPTSELLPASTYQNYYSQLPAQKSTNSLTDSVEKLERTLSFGAAMRK